MNQFTLEQEFKLAIYSKKIQELNNFSTKQYLLHTLKQMIIQENFIKYYFKQYIN